MSTFVQENRRSVIMLAIALGVLVLFVGFKLVSGGSAPPPSAEPTHVAPSSAPSEPTEDTVVQVRQPRGVSDRDPFKPLPAELDEDADAGTDTSGSGGSPSKSEAKTSSGSAVTEPDPPTDIAKRNTPAGSQSGDAATKKSKSDDSGSKAPVPIGGGVKKEGESTGITIIDVAEAVAIVRINDIRTTLYLNVPDPSGVTFVASLGGGCGWFAASGAEDRLTICEGDTRQL